MAVPVPAGIRERDGGNAAEWPCASGASDRGLPTGRAAAAVCFASGALAAGCVRGEQQSLISGRRRRCGTALPRVIFWQSRPRYRFVLTRLSD